MAALPPLPSPHTRLGVGGVLVRDGRVLVNRAVYRDRFTIPSGYVEAGETLAAALVREFAEETGVIVDVGHLLLARHKVVRADESDVYFAFAVERRSGDPEARPPEIAEVREVPIVEATTATWISELSRTAIRLATGVREGWSRSTAIGAGSPARATEAYHPELPPR
jgi:ADP-ribose pyrophosphatase YjhB (NUDIX family)